jgi:mannonate dehydratase
MSEPIRITEVRTILTQPGNSRLVVVKLLTSEPGLYGLGCATFTQRIHAVHAAIDRHLKPLLIGREVSRIEEMWQLMMVNSYWRNSPVLNNAISGIDQALWDIQGKRAGMPVYQLLGGKCREGAAVYVHADGTSAAEVAESVQAYIERGFRYVRVQLGGYGGRAANLQKPIGALDGAYFDPRAYMRATLSMIEHVRKTVGDQVELLHDIHERLVPIDAVQFAKRVEPYDLFFLEDPFAPEDIEWLAMLRQQSAVPIAIGELFNHPMEWRSLVANRLLDFIRMHMSTMGGLTPARNVALFAQMYGVRTAWHGPGDVSPVGKAANIHLDVWAPNFGIQEWSPITPAELDVFPGCPTLDNGYAYPNDKPGWGIDIDEALAAKFPCEEIVEQWTQTRLPDGSITRP